MRAIVGEWIKISVPGEPWPVSMSIGNSPPEPAFVEHELVGEEVRTIVQRRCPQLAPGNYNVIVYLPTGTIVDRVRVV